MFAKDLYKYRGTKLQEYIFTGAEYVKIKLLSGGVNRLPREILIPEYCLFCGSKMRAITLRNWSPMIKLYVCQNCGYCQPGFSSDLKDTEIGQREVISVSQFIRLGFLLSLGLSALLYLMKDSER